MVDKDTKVKEVMETNVIWVNDSDRISDCVKKMTDNRIGCVIVKDSEAVVGVITQQDLTRKVLAKNLDPNKTKVKEIMTLPVKTIDPDKSVDDALTIMRYNNLKHIPVVSRGKLIGIVSTKDLIVGIDSDKYFLLSTKKITMILVAWFVFVLAHNTITHISGSREVIFLTIVVFIIPSYFVVAMIYTVLARFTREKRS